MTTNWRAAARRLVAVGYMPPTARDSCTRCAKSEPHMWGQIKVIHCTLHTAKVASLGWCPSFDRIVK